MFRLAITLAALLAPVAVAGAASVVNNDSEARTVIVAEGSARSELVVEPGASQTFCPTGCFVTLPNGDRQALTGEETIEIKDGVGRIK